MKAKDAYLETAQRYLASAKKNQSLGIDIQEVIGFLVYHALESLAVAVIIHFKSTIPLNHETKLRMFLGFCKKNLAESINLKSVASVIIRIEKSSYRSKFLYPEFKNDNHYKLPEEQITINEARLLVRDIDRIINQINELI
ncbi:HEPN domain-containing protein [Crocosphaera sp. XPORK-15E]|uniref:HEPN domain-containing protein n=1 Tax=Crocosphaera sp. XPORK-15E TaxID=3110247 RepID=UPI002B21CBA1|nr:HEPN domain-containing protein [Crocosphaera sp. XPORK-15E]MEA5535388.1 HEPN domain-containing protein [Crocosphaera sp. XPORK-15E]